MSFLWLGCLSFATLYLFDRLKMQGKNVPLLFALGCTGIFAGSFGCFFAGNVRFILWPWMRAILLLLAAAEGLVMLWALFFALPKGTYGGNSSATVDRGLYALCRHPGVLCFVEMHIYLWLLSGRDMMLAAAILFTACDVLHVYVQDKIYFPKTLHGYEDYKKTTPFLIPNRASIDRCIKTFK